MAKISAETKVGIMTAIAIIILVVGTLMIGKFAGFGKTYIIKTYFDFVSGIEKGAPVRLGGVKIGIVKEINIVPTHKPSIELVLRISKQAMIHQNARVFISTMGLMGEKYVEIYEGTPDTPLLANGDSLTGQNPLQMEDLLASSKQITEALTKTLQAISDVVSREETKKSMIDFIMRLDSISTRIDTILARKQGDLEQFTTNLREATDQMKIVIADIDSIVKENRAGIKATVTDFSSVADTVHKNVDRIVENLNKITDQLNTMIAKNQDGVNTTVANFQTASEDFKKAMVQINDITNKVQSGQGTVGKLIGESKLYDDTSQMVGSVRQAADEVKNVASKTGDFLTNINLEYDLRYYDRLDRWRNDIDIRFNPSKGKYYLAGVSDVGRNPEVDLLFAKSYGFWDAKLGVLESQAAAGVDYRAFNDSLKLGIKSVGLTQPKPRLDFDSEVHLVDYWYLVLGAHDLTHDIQSNAGVKIRY